MDRNRSEYVHVMLTYRTRTKVARLSRSLDKSLSSYANLQKLIFKHFPEVEDVASGKSDPNARSWRTSATQRVEVKWKDENGNLIVLEDDEDLEAVDLGKKSHVELQIEVSASSRPALALTSNSPRSGWNSGEKSNGFDSARYKTKLCTYFQSGYCKYGDSCNFIHNPSDGSNRQNGTSPSTGIQLLNQRNASFARRVQDDSQRFPTARSIRTGLQQNASFGRAVQDDSSPNAPIPRRKFQRRPLQVSASTNLEIDNWLIANLELSGAQSIEQLSDSDGLDALDKLVERRNLTPKTVDLLVRVLAKEEIRTSLLRQKTNSIYGVLPGSVFLLQLHSHIISYFGSQRASPNALRPYLFLIEELQSRTAEGWKEVPLDAMQTVVSRLAEGDTKKDLEEMVCRLLDQREKQQRLLAVAPADNDLEGAEFRQMPIVATKEELVGCQPKRNLPINQIGYRYTLKDYLHTHFTLLREDCMDPLREGIALYRRSCLEIPNQKNSANSIQALRIYSDVRVAAVRCGDQGIEYVFQFDVSKGKDTPESWETSKRLMPGALLCISSDQYRSFFSGVVSRRNVKDLAKGLVAIRLLTEKEGDDSGGQQALLDTSQTYVMVESTAAYFEAYYHVLKNLQREEMDKLPFQRQLLDLEPTVGPPSYIQRRHGGDEYDFSKVFPELEEKMGRGSMRILQANWPAELAGALGLDKAQLAALKQGLTKELAIIQGPPGTGKTFLGTLLVKLLLTNLKRHSADSDSGVDALMNGGPIEYELSGPIQIICYTNHALDQFLEGLYKSGITDLIRIGGRSKSEVLKERTLFHLLERQREAKKLDGSYRRFFGQERAGKDSMEERIHKAIDKMSQKHVNVELLREVATPEQICNLFGQYGFLNGALSVQVVEIWLNDEECVDSSMALHYGLQVDEHAGFAGGSDWEEAESRGKKTRGSLKMLPKEGDDDEGGWTQVRRRRRNRRRAPIEDQLAFRVEQLRIADQIQEDEDEADWEPEGRVGRINGHVDEEIEDPLHGFVNATNVWDLNLSQRRRLHEYWLNEIRSNCRRELRNLTEMYEEASKNVMEVENDIQLDMLRSARVVGMTTTAAAKYHDLMKSLKSEIVVIEEAAEVLEAHILACLSPSVKHLILIGDHKQLRPSVAVYRLVTECKLDVSMFERLVRSGIEHVTLEEQRRMRPSISKLMKGLYPNSRDHVSVRGRKDVTGVAQNVFFFDHKAEERNSKGEDGSKVNPVEARLVVELCMYLLNQPEYGPENITILTMYGGQLVEIRKLLTERCRNRMTVRPVRKKSEEAAEDEEEDLQIPRVSSVDDFQGEESEIIILSLVRSNEIETREGIGKIGFLKIENRICVALTRAREGLFIFGNATLLADNSKLWKTVTDGLRADGALDQHLELYCKNHPSTRTRIRKVEEFKQVEDGGCNLPCEHQLDCGHACPRRCHRTSHDFVICPKACLKKYEECNHTCTRRCHGESACPSCRAIVTRKLINCNHEQTMTCDSKLEDEICTSACERTLPCGHRCRMRCGRPCTDRCQELVTKTLPCGHSATTFCCQPVEAVSCTVPCRDLLDCEHPCQGTCGNCKRGTAHIDCKKKCGRSLPCGHSCEAKCSAPCPPCEKRCRKRCQHSRCPKVCGELCMPCREPCAWRCPHHRCNKACHEICTRAPCDVACPEVLRCGHPCIGLCGEPCPTKCRVCHADTKEIITQMELGEFEESDRFIQLEDCRHIFEVEGLDKWMEPAKPGEGSSGSVAVKLKECPECRTPIFKTTRYSNSVKATLGKIEQVKRKVLGYECLKEGNDHLARRDYKRALRSYTAALSRNRGLMEAHFQTGYVFFLVQAYARAIIHLSFVVERSSFGKRLENLIRRVEVNDSGSSRGAFLAVKEKLARYPGQTDNNLAIKAMLQLASTLASSRKFSEATEICDVVLESDPENSVAKSVKDKAGRGEVELVMQAMATELGLQGRGHWFQCPNGHYYTIGECGGATQQSRCPDCNATVGGGSHRLAAGNRPANIDGSDPSSYAWRGDQQF